MEGIVRTRDQVHRTTGEYGNMGDNNSNGTGTDVTTTTPLGGGGYGHEGQQHHGGGVTGKLHRSGTSSSSEDDGMGGRRKKGIKDKVKEKLPGGNKDEKTISTTTQGGAYGYEGEQGHENKGMMDKIQVVVLPVKQQNELEKMEGIGHTRDQARRTTDEHGNITHQGAGNMGTGVTTPLGGGGYGHEGQQQHHGGGVTGMLHRSGSSGSSSSEDDGLGGRRKKGLKDKIEEKLPGGNKDEQRTSIPNPGVPNPGAPAYGNKGEQGNEQKGMMDKIKDILPGGRRD